MDIRKAAVYCGTYYKYSSGSIFGKWMRLADYDNKEKFLGACAKVHKGERDPEFMFQDYEYIPQGLVGESWISEDIWKVLAELKGMEEERVQEFIAWCDENGYEQDLQAIQEFKSKPVAKVTVKAVAVVKSDEEDKELFAEALKLARGDEKWAKDLLKDVTAVRLSDGKLVVFGKPTIEKDFCFGYSDWGQGMTYDEANELVRKYSTDGQYFVKDNLKREYGYVERLENASAEEPVYIVPMYGREDVGLYKITTNKYALNAVEVPADDVEKLLKHAKALSDKFEKKLNNYIKRYGTDKLKVWTYWADE